MTRKRPSDKSITRCYLSRRDGSRCGYSQKAVLIESFSGDCRVNSLEVYPVSFHKDPEGLRGAMLERGRKFERLGGYRAQIYKGSMHLLDDAGEKQVSSIWCFRSLRDLNLGII